MAIQSQRRLSSGRGVLSLRKTSAMLGLLLAGSLTQVNAAAVEVPEFYEGKTVRFTTSNSPGGGFDQYMRLVANHFTRVTGVDTAAQNITGAGGVIGDNELFAAEPDGLTIGLINFPGHVFNQILNRKGVQYDFRQWEWLGRVAGVAPGLAVGAETKYRTFQDALNSTEPIRFGLEGRGSDAFYGTVFLENLLGMPVEQIVGYGGPGEISAAMVAGEIDARFESVDTLLKDVEQGLLRILVVFDTERDERLPEVPSLPDLALAEDTQDKLEAFANIYKLERSFVAPPDTPKDRVAFLRAALKEVFASEAFQRELEAAGRSLAAMGGAELQEEAETVASQVQELIPLFQEN